MKFERIGKSVWGKKANSNNKESMVRYCTMYMHTQTHTHLVCAMAMAVAARR